MNGIKGYIVKLTEQREVKFKNHHHDSFGEPVPDFSHSRNIPLVCFIVNNSGQLTHIALGKRGNLAGTDVRRLNLNEIFVLSSIVDICTIIDESPNRLKKKIEEKFFSGGLLPPKSFEFLVHFISKIAPETASILSKYSESRVNRIKNLSPKIQETLAEQKEAVATAMTIAGIDRGELQGWDVDEKKGATSFLDGLDQVRLREDPMVINDLTKLPGYDTLKITPFSSVVFENDKSKLTVVLANRLPLEEQLGVDLIYYNETFSCFLMIQYKAMEKEGDNSLYRFPNSQLTKEIDRMKSVLTELNKLPVNTEVDGFRLSENPFFLKMCPRIVFNPDNVGLVKGMYLPLEYWEMLSDHPSMVGSQGGRHLSYRNVRRYFDNTEFVTMASGGWIGTNIVQSKLLESVIRSTLESGRSVVFAVKNEKNLQHCSG